MSEYYHPFQENYADLRPGPVLWPERFNRLSLERTKRHVGPRTWAGLYQGDPRRKAGKIFNYEFEHYKDDMLAKIGTSKDSLRYQKIVVSWDTAFEPEEVNDWSACVVIGYTGYYWDIFHVERGRWEFPKLKRRARAILDEWEAWARGRDQDLLKHDVKHGTEVFMLIEKKSSGHSLIQEMRIEFKGKVRKFKPVGSKHSRAESVQGVIEAGRVRLPRSAPWLATFLNELDQFPEGANDDQVDAFVQGIRYTRRGDGQVIGVS